MRTEFQTHSIVRTVRVEPSALRSPATPQPPTSELPSPEPPTNDSRTRLQAAGRWTRRGVVAGLGVGAAALVLGPGRRSSIPAGRVRLRYWEKWTGLEGDAVQRLVDRFNASQDRIWVERTPVADVFSKAMVAIGGGDPPDVVGLFSWNVPTFAEAGAFMALEEFAGAEHLREAHYAPGIQRLLTHEDKLWCGVNTCYTLALYADRARLAAAGWERDTPPRTLEELDEVSMRCVERDDSGRLQRVGFLPNVPLWWPYSWPFLFGGDLWDAERERITFASDECVRAYEWVSSVAERHGRAQSASFGRSFDRVMLSGQDPFLSGDVAMIVQGPWMANFARQHQPKLDYFAGPVPVPAADYDPEAPRGMLECDVLAIPRGCPHPEEAWEFVAFMQTRDAQEQLARAHCKGTPLSSASDEFYVDHPNPFVRVHDAVAKSPAVSVLPETRAWKPFSDLTVGAFDAIWSGADVKAELLRVQDRAQAIVDVQAEYRAKRRGQS